MEMISEENNVEGLLNLIPADVPKMYENPDAWKVLIVDDDKSVHDVTEMSLRGCIFSGAPLQLMHAYSGSEARQIIADNDDIALILLDVVMETSDAGLKVVEYIRGELNNRTARIAIRTGQPGEAPQNEVISKYDINDYKEKSDLTHTKLFSMVYTSIRAYQDLLALESSRRGLEKLVDSITQIFQASSINDFAQAVLEQLTAILGLRPNAVFLHADAHPNAQASNEMLVIAGTGKYANQLGVPASEILDEDLLLTMENLRAEQQCSFGDNYCIHFQITNNGSEKMLYVGSHRVISPSDRLLIYLFAQNVAVAHEHLVAMNKLNS